VKRTLLAAALLSAAAQAASPPTDLYVPGTDNDPRLRENDLLQTEHKFYSATSDLLRIQSERPQLRLPAPFYSRLADASLSFGVRARAEQIYRELLAANPDPVPQYRARVRLAEFLHERSRDQEAVQELRALRDGLPEPVQREWQDTLARSLLSQGRYSEAAELLSDTKLSGEASQYARYNLAIALINDGRVGQGVNVMDRVGRYYAKTEEEYSLRDQANLLLGYHFLRQGQGGTAVPVFSRVRSQGAMSNRALLGLGWAFLAPQGTNQRKVVVGDEDADGDDQNGLRSLSTIGVLLRPGFADQDIFKRLRLSSFQRTRGSASDEEALKRALVPWLELAGRDPIDPTVQEGLLAIPYCLERLGAHEQAREFYERGIAALDAARKRIDLTIWYVKSGRMLQTMVHRTVDAESGWTWELNDLPNGEETFYLQKLIAGNRFQEQVKNYRDLLMMQRNLEAWLTRIDELQNEYTHRKPQELPVEVLFAEAQGKPVLNSLAPPPGLNGLTTPQLRTDSSLTAPQPGQAPAAAGATVATTSTTLQVAGAPAQKTFVGVYERLDQLKTRIAIVQPKLAAAADRQSALVEAMALDDMTHQKRVTEKYLIEARFALARVYDKELKGSGK
jgi:tetratricopeptide (TPR) repeat protein